MSQQSALHVAPRVRRKRCGVSDRRLAASKPVLVVCSRVRNADLLRTRGGLMGQWMMIVMALIGGLLIAVTKSSVVAGLGVIMFLGGLIGATFSLAASRITSRSRDDTAMLSPDVLQAIRDKAARDAATQAGRSVPAVVHRPD